MNPDFIPTHRHRNGNSYRLLMRHGVFIENGKVPAVVYEDMDGTLWACPIEEFDDGRFTPIVAGGQ